LLRYTLRIEAFQQLITQSFPFQSKQSLANLHKLKKADCGMDVEQLEEKMQQKDSQIASTKPRRCSNAPRP
jgi:hypothetical protein